LTPPDGAVAPEGASGAAMILRSQRPIGIEGDQLEGAVISFRIDRSPLRATGLGVSTIADYQGRMLGQQHYGDGGGVMLATIPTRGVVTIYSRTGDSFAYLNAASLILLAAWALARKPSVAALAS
jgi:hypothetical protein